MAANDRGLIKRVRYTSRNVGGNLTRTHFQGIQRLRDGQHFVISGGDFFDSTAQLFTVQVKSFCKGLDFSKSTLTTHTKGKIRRGPYGSNLLNSGFPPNEDHITFITQINQLNPITSDEGGKGYWHGGGIAISGDILAVPLEDTEEESSMIRFFSLKNPNKPVILPGTDIIRNKDIGKAGAVALCRLQNGHFLCAVWVDGKGKKNQRIDFYLSHDTQIENGFQTGKESWHYRDLIGQSRSKTTYQNIQFVVQENNKLFLIGTENTSDGAPIVGGQNCAELMEVDFSNNIATADNPVVSIPTLTLVNRKEFARSRNYYNMDAGAGIYISSNKDLLLYAVYHWRLDGEIHFAEFAPRLLKNDPVITDINQSKIEIYEHDNYRGRVIRLYGEQCSRLNNYKNIFVQEGQFDDKASSVKFQLPIGHTYNLYEHREFGGIKFPLVGTGRVEEIANLKDHNDFGDEVSSSKF